MPDFSKYRIRSGGCGGFLNPPTHPAHTLHVTDGLNSYMSLESCAKEGHMASKAFLANWKAPPLNSPEVQEWILQVLGYFRGCYIPSSGSRNVSGLEIKRQDFIPQTKADIDAHRGVDFIRQFYPEFAPSPQHFENAY